jgi:hypothetical protein
MYSRAHGAISLSIGVGLVAAGIEWVHPLVVVGYAIAIGVGIDFDHFLVARYNTGEWRALRYLLANPRRALADQSTIFDPEDIDPFERLLSHTVIVGVTVPVTWLFDPALGLVTAVTLYGHVLSDLLADVRQFEGRLREESL